MKVLDSYKENEHENHINSIKEATVEYEGNRRLMMLDIHKKIVLDENQHPFAVMIPIDEFERLEELIENYGLSKLMDEVNDEERLSVKNAKEYYRNLKPNVES